MGEGRSAGVEGVVDRIVEEVHHRGSVDIGKTVQPSCEVGGV